MRAVREMKVIQTKVLNSDMNYCKPLSENAVRFQTFDALISEVTVSH